MVYDSCDVKRTSDLEKVRAGAPYTWGEVVAIHEIGDFSIVEALGWRTSGVHVDVGVVDAERRSFHGYINGERTARSSDSLDATLADCIALKYDGVNTQAGWFFLRAIGAVPQDAYKPNRVWGKRDDGS